MSGMKIVLVDVEEKQQEFAFLAPEHVLDFQESVAIEQQKLATYDVIVISEHKIKLLANMRIKLEQLVIVALIDSAPKITEHKPSKNYIDYIFFPLTPQQWQLCQQRWQQWQQQQRKAATTALQFETLLENIPYMAWFKDTASRYIQTNHHFQSHCGKSRPKFIAVMIHLFGMDKLASVVVNLIFKS